MLVDLTRVVNKRQRCEGCQADRVANTEPPQSTSGGAMGGGVARSSVCTLRGKKYELNQESEGLERKSLVDGREKSVFRLSPCIVPFDLPSDV